MKKQKEKNSSPLAMRKFSKSLMNTRQVLPTVAEADVALVAEAETIMDGMR